MKEVTLGTIYQKLDDLIEGNSKDHVRIETQTTKTNGRVRLLEKFIWALSGGLVIGAFLASNYMFPLISDVQAKINGLDSSIDQKISTKILNMVKTDKNGTQYIEISQ